MCTFVIKLRAGDERDYVQRKFQVVRFEYENSFMWFFTVRAIEEKIHGKFYELDEEEKIMAFPKKREIGEKFITEDGMRRKVPIYEELSAPRFYNKLRNRAIMGGTMQVQGDDAPPLEDEELFT